MRQGTEDVKEIPKIQNEPESVESLPEAAQTEFAEMTPEELKAGQELAEMLLGMINKETESEESEPEEIQLEEAEAEPEEIQLEEIEAEPEAVELEEDEFPRFAPLKQAGLNVKLGMDYCCGEEEFYKEMLDTFQKHSREKEVELVTLYKTGNWEDYIIKVHALKSTSLTIGAEGLSELARAIEQAGKAGNMDFVHRNHLKLLLLYEEVCKSIAKLE